MKHKAKKSLGQNFLKSDNVLRKIVEAGEINTEDIILEIGPGKGALTEKLLEKSSKVIAVEKDRDLFAMLQEKFAKEISEGRLILLEGDILSFCISDADSKFFSGPRFSGSLSRPDHSKNLNPLCFKIVANIPYNITGAILKKFLTEEAQPSSMVLMVQHEVATRILAKDNKESILSISIKAYGKPKMITKVDKRYFSPAPKVNSAVIKIDQISKKTFIDNGIDEERFWEIVKTGFAHKRKILSSNLKGVVNLTEETKKIVGNKRAEDLSLSDWILIAKS
jgi:16S rRNA (adenine1518-N6/adenine1519-N6)-dimethyltransferase